MPEERPWRIRILHVDPRHAASPVDVAFTGLPGFESVDLQSGLISRESAIERRKEIESRADFFGSMDSLGILLRREVSLSGLIFITSIAAGIAKGLALGLSVSEALSSYTVTSLSSSLLFSIPAFLISKSILLILSEKEDVTDSDICCQKSCRNIFHGLTVLCVVTGALEFFEIIHRTGIPFFLVAEILLLAGRFTESKKEKQRIEDVISTETCSTDSRKGQIVHAGECRLGRMDGESYGQSYFILEAGNALYRHLHLEGRESFRKELERAERMIAGLTAFRLPSISIAYSPAIKEKAYRITIYRCRLNRFGYAVKTESIIAAFEELQFEGFLAIGSRKVLSRLRGAEISHPVTNLPCKWIKEHAVERALSLGCTVRSPEELLADHIEAVYQRYSHRFLTASYIQSLFAGIRTSLAIKSAFEQQGIDGETINDLLQALLREGVSIADYEAIIDAIADFSPCSTSFQQLYEYVRAVISSPHHSGENEQSHEADILCLSDITERFLVSISDMPEKDLILSASHRVGRALLRMIWKEVERSIEDGKKPLLLCDLSLRASLRELTGNVLSELEIYSYQQISEKTVQADLRCRYISLPSSITGAGRSMKHVWAGSAEGLGRGARSSEQEYDGARYQAGAV
ncbi:MAG: FHIPEP family type III secretion protein [Candidatus Xenobiia bacterium LiM19]